ncbi:transcriptional regulator KdgR [mine drainage metagenome]|uniref:Transcriptional regulator KdgR n=1 Tax=mine drainage metagenome TaxID=410659 RepID=A0A1J5QDS3_9ZZZZ
MTSNQSNAAAVRAFRVLELLAGAESMSLMQLANGLELPKQTVHRILQTLCAADLVIRNIDGQGYECGGRVRNMSVALLMHSGPATARHAVLRKLGERIGETVNLTVLDGDEVIYLDRVETASPLRMHLQPGSHVPLHCTSSGKLLLSLQPAALRNRIVDALPLKKMTDFTITNAARLRQELVETRKRRIGLNDQEFIHGMASIAVPVMRDAYHAWAAVAVQAPLARSDINGLLEHLPALREAAAAIAAMVTPRAPRRARASRDAEVADAEQP